MLEKSELTKLISFDYNWLALDIQKYQKMPKNGKWEFHHKQELALWVWNVARGSPALERRWLAQLASSGNFQRFLAGFLGLGWLALGRICSGFSLVQRTVSIASWLLHVAKMADELIQLLGNQEKESLMISKSRSEEETDKLTDRFQSPGKN